VTLKTRVKATDNSALHHRRKLHFKVYLNGKQLVYIVKKFHNITVFSFEQKILVKKMKRSYQPQTFER